MLKLLPSLVFLVPTLAFGQAALTPKQVYERCRDSVVSLEVETDKGPFTGTGFFYEDGRTIVTALHVIEGAKSISVKARNGDVWIPVAVSFDASADTALLRLGADSGRKPIPHAPSNTVAVGDPVVVIGDPLGLTGSLSTGVVGALRKVDAMPLVQITAAISPGSSGGPVLDAKGRAIGLISFFMTNGQNLNMAISTAVAKRLVDAKTSETLTAFFAGGGKATRTTTVEAAPSSREEARRQFGAEVGRLFSDIYTEMLRWENDWGTTIHNNDSLAIRRIAEASDRLVAICPDESRRSALISLGEAAGASADEMQELVESYDAVRTLARAAGTAAVEAKTAAAKGSEPELVAADRLYGQNWGRLDQAWRDMFKSQPVKAIDDSSWWAAVSDPVKGALLLTPFHAHPDVDLPGSTTILNTFGWTSSDLASGDAIVGIAIDAESPVFTPVAKWRDASAFDFNVRNESKAHILLKVQRHGETLVLREYDLAAKDREARSARGLASYFVGTTHGTGGQRAVFVAADPATGLVSGMKINGIGPLGGSVIRSVITWDDVLAYLRESSADRVRLIVTDASGNSSEKIVQVDRRGLG